MKNLETLYKRTKTGAIQYWKIEVKLDDGAALICKESGQLGTKNPILHKEEVMDGKQKRNYAEQADFQAQSDWRKKRDEGYKTASEIYPEELGKWDAVNSKDLASMLSTYLPQFNTDASGNAKPMLATDWKKVKKINYPIYCEPKYDGVRCLMIVKPDSGGEFPQVTFLSRKGKEYTALKHITKAIEDAMEELPYDSFILDGEIYSDELGFQEIVSAVKAFKPDSLKLQFRAYDIINDEEQGLRRNALSCLVSDLNSSFITCTSWYIAEDAYTVKILHDEFVKAGFEGAILRELEGKYAQGQRSRELMKVKEFDETEFEAISWTHGQREEDLMAICISHKASEARKADKDDMFTVKMMGSAEQKRNLEKIDINGKKITVKHFGWTDDGLPRFPIGKSIRDYE